MNKVILNETEFRDDANRAIELARCLLQDDKDYLDTVLELNRIGNRLVGEVWDTKFHVFGIIASDTDHLPTKKVRPLCSQSMLEKSDEELEDIINFYEKDVADACRKILSKYQNV